MIDEESRKKIEQPFNEALKLRSDGKLKTAYKILSRLAKENPTIGEIAFMTGSVCWELGHLDESIDRFRKATVLSPDSEIASIGLFHTLWEAEEYDAAFLEMKRFISTHKSEKYRSLLKEMKQDLEM